MIRILTFLASLVLAGPALAQCKDGGLLDSLTRAERASMDTNIAAATHPRGRFWRVEKDGAKSLLFGTVHFNGKGIFLPEALVDAVPKARLLLLEMTTDDEVAFQRDITTNPELIFNIDGPDLPPYFSDSEWLTLTRALSEIGVPTPLVIRMKPWFLNLTLMLPPCAAKSIAAGEKGLDRQLEDIATRSGTPVGGLEQAQDVMSVFQTGTFEEQIAMIRTTLSMYDTLEAGVTATLKLYAKGETMAVWELSRVLAERRLPKAEVTQSITQAWDIIVAKRNRAWMDRLIAEMTDGNVIAAVGALHLPSVDGLLSLLEAEGFTVTLIPE